MTLGRSKILTETRLSSIRVCGFCLVGWLVLVAGVMAGVAPCAAAGAEKFKPTVESLRQYQCPEWFRDAKFGIYAPWNPYTVANADGARDGWYARNLYRYGSPSYDHHVKHYGHPSKVGYKDIIEMWKAEKFDPDRLAAICKDAGAKYVAPMAVHHDNYDLYNSRHHKWNSVNYGPKKDIVGLWREAILKQGLRFGVTTHNSRAYSWFQTNKGSDRGGPLKGVPYDGNDPKYKDLYIEKCGDTSKDSPVNAPESWRKEWALRTKDLIDQYQPDLLYFDAATPFRGDDQGRTGMEVFAHYYNQNMKWHGGELEGVITTKPYAVCGVMIDGITTINGEGHQVEDAADVPWQICLPLANYFWKPNLPCRPAEFFINHLVSIVSRNGNLIVAIALKPDGTLEKDAEYVLYGIGQWLKVNGEAIYGTRPRPKDFRSEGETVRFTRSKDNKTIYAICLAWPERQLVLKTVVAEPNSKIFMLGYDKPLTWQQDAEKGLVIKMPAQLDRHEFRKGYRPCRHAWSVKIEGHDAE